MEKIFSKKEGSKVPRVNIHNDKEMVSLGLRLKPLSGRDPEVWTKSAKEKRELRKRRRSGLISGGWSIPLYSIDVPGKLVVYLKGFPRVSKEKWLDSQPHSTRSYKCVLSDVEGILAARKKEGLTVVKYEWNGRTYSNREVPVRLNRGFRVSK